MRVNRRALNAVHIVSVTIKDREHFYKVVHWLNKNIGIGGRYWSMEGRVLIHLRHGGTITREIYIYTENFDKQEFESVTI